MFPVKTCNARHLSYQEGQLSCITSFNREHYRGTLGDEVARQGG